MVEQQFHPVGQHRGERLHALDARCRRPACPASSASPGCSAASCRARSRTAGVSSSSRHGGAHRPSRRRAGCAGRRPGSSGSPRRCRPRTRPAAGAPRWAGTRRGCRRAPRSRRAAPPGRCARSRSPPAGRRPPRGRRPGRRAAATGSRSPSPPTIGCSRLRTGVTTTVSGPARGLAGSGWASRRSTASRCPEVSERGESRSCGSVSQAGKQATRARRAAASQARWSGPRPHARSPSRPARTGAWPGPGEPSPVASAPPRQPGRAAARAGRRGRRPCRPGSAHAGAGVLGDDAEQSGEAHGVLDQAARKARASRQQGAARSRSAGSDSPVYGLARGGSSAPGVVKPAC